VTDSQTDHGTVTSLPVATRLEIVFSDVAYQSWRNKHYAGWTKYCSFNLCL